MENNDESRGGSGGGSGSGSGSSGGSSSSGSGGGPADALKKLFTAGLSAAFMTEESIRSFVSELKLPKETLNLLLQGAAKSKEELMNRVSGEIIKIISKIDFVKEASRFVEEHKFRVSAEIEVIRKEKGAAGSSGSGGGSGASEITAKVSVVPGKVDD